MFNPREICSAIHELLGTEEPVAITFSDTEPAGIERAATAAPAGCAYWKMAAEGKSFYTIEADHLNCPIGAYTHGADMTPAVHELLQGTIEKMVGIQYLKMEEIPNIPRRSQPLHFVIYAPLSQATEMPDVVLLRGNARQVMLATEAARACGKAANAPAMGRPACAVVPAGMASGQAAISLGCIGNRVYTELADDDLYVAIPGRALGEVVDALRSIVAANTELERYHRAKRASA